MPSTQSVQSSALTSFADLSIRATTHDALARMDINTPTKVQAESLPILLAGRDLIGQSRTGSGKTLAFGIPAIEVVDPAIRAIQVLVLTPTRELAVQVGDVIKDLAQGTGIRSVLVYGGRAMGPQKDALRRGAQIVVGTPGRVADLYGQGDLRLDHVRFLVLDEADEMLDRGFAPQVNKILSWTPGNRQTALFSATMPDWVSDASHKHLRNPSHVAIQVTQAEQTQIDHVAYDVPAGGKIDALKELLDNRGDGQVIVFGRTKHGVKKLAKQLTLAGYPVAALQGNMSQNARDQVMADFRAGAVSILLATNVAARGIDVTAVDHVINFELPESPELLQHRIGRTGRMDRAGSAITLLGAEDHDKWRQLMRGFGKQIPRQPWPGAHRTGATPRIIVHTPQANQAPVAPRETTRPAAVDVGPRRQSDRRPQRSPESERPVRPAANGSRDHRRTDSDRPARSGHDSRDRRDGRRDNQPAPAPVGQRRNSSISVVSDMIRERRPDGQSQVRSSASGGAASPVLRGSFQIGDLIDQEKFSFRSRGVSRHSERRETSELNSAPAMRRPAFSTRETTPAGEVEAPRGNGQHTAPCSECGATATLRFAPDLSRPVYCDSCFAERRKQNRRAGSRQ